MRKQYSAAALLMLGALASTTAQAQDASRIQTKVLGDDNQPVLVQFNVEGKMAYRGASGEQVLRQQLGHVNGLALRAVADLMPAAGAVGHHNRIGLIAHRRQQA